MDWMAMCCVDLLMLEMQARYGWAPMNLWFAVSREGVLWFTCRAGHSRRDDNRLADSFH